MLTQVVGFVLAELEVTDADVGANAEVAFVIAVAGVYNDEFAIVYILRNQGRTVVQLQLAEGKDLDYETAQSYQVSIEGKSARAV